MPQGERLYVHSCYATAEKSHRSSPKFPVVKNFGYKNLTLTVTGELDLITQKPRLTFLSLYLSCMVESKNNRSRFVPYKPSAVRFSVDAFLFKGMSGQVSRDLCLNSLTFVQIPG